MEGNGISTFTASKHVPKDKSYLARDRKARNESEKNRRDRLNGFINELAKEIPLAETSIKLDKCSILRLAVSFLRLHKDLRRLESPCKNWKPDFLNDEELSGNILEGINGFLFIVAEKYFQLAYISKNALTLLGHEMTSVMGRPIDRIVHPADHELIKKQFLLHRDVIALEPQSPNTSERSKGPDVAIDSSLQRAFRCRFLCVGRQTQLKTYTNVDVIGHLTQSKARNNLMNISPQEIPSGKYLVAVGRIASQEPILELAPIMDSNPLEWVTKHDMDGKIVFTDHRACTISGYLPNESMGLSPYNIIHKADLVIIGAHHQMLMQTGEIPCTVFRLITRSSNTVFIKSQSHFILDSWTSRPKCIISVNTVLTQAHGKSLLRAQHKKVKELMESTQKLSLNDDGSTGTASTASDDGVDSDISARDSPQEYEQSIGVDCEMDMAYDGNEGPLQLTSSESHLQISVGESNFIVDLKPRHDATAMQDNLIPSPIGEQETQSLGTCESFKKTPISEVQKKLRRKLEDKMKSKRNMVYQQRDNIDPKRDFGKRADQTKVPDLMNELRSMEAECDRQPYPLALMGQMQTPTSNVCLTEQHSPDSTTLTTSYIIPDNGEDIFRDRHFPESIALSRPHFTPTKAGSVFSSRCSSLSSLSPPPVNGEPIIEHVIPFSPPTEDKPSETDSGSKRSLPGILSFFQENDSYINGGIPPH